MRAIFESAFDIIYLVGVIATGIVILVRSEGRILNKLIGTMSIILGVGDSFHLVPRIYCLFTNTFDQNAAALGFGKAVTSVTMTVFYLILYYVWRERYNIFGKLHITIAVWALSIIRIALCFFPQNNWFSANSSFIWGIYRNIPFLILGVIIIVLFAGKVRVAQDLALLHMPLAISLSFALYIPVVLFADIFPLIGMLMIPKTVAYAWIIWMCARATKKHLIPQ